MPTPFDNAPTMCPNCGTSVPGGARFCPRCGTDVPPPLPALGDAPDTTPLFWTGSRGGDNAAGALLGIVAPPIAGMAWSWLLMYVVMSLYPTGYIGLFVAVWGGIPCLLAVLFFLARRMARSRYHIEQVARKYFLGWFWLVTVLLLGLLATCIVINLPR